MLLPIFVLVGSILNAVGLKLGDHAVKLATPQFLEPICFTKPLYKGRADGIIRANEQSAVPSGAERIVAETAKRPNLRAII